MQRWRVSAILLLLGAVTFVAPHAAQAQTAGSTVYLDPASPFSNDFSAAVIKKKVPVTVTTDPAKAEYTVTFSVANQQGSVVRGITTTLTTGTYDSGAWDQATMQIVDTQSKNVVFSYTCKKRNAEGESMTTSVAECLAKHWKQHMGQ